MDSCWLMPGFEAAKGARDWRWEKDKMGEDEPKSGRIRA